jgi:hypothetical protein
MQACFWMVCSEMSNAKLVGCALRQLAILAHGGNRLGGGTYAPYVLNRYTTAAESEGAGRSSTIYWVVSTWNPYEVSVMRTTLHVDSR